MLLNGQPIQEITGHAGGNLAGLDRGAINKTAAFEAVGYQSALLHFSQHRGDGRVGEVSRGKRLVYIRDGGFRAFPKGFHDLELEISETESLGFAQRLHGLLR